MKKIFTILIFLVILTPFISAQRIVFESDFETLPLQLPDSIPTGWFKLDVDANNPSITWAVRDTSMSFNGRPTRPQAHNSAKSLEIPWYAGQGGNDINDDWVFTTTFSAQTGDSLIFWMLIGGTATYNPGLIDSMQLHICFDQDPGASIQKLGTLVSSDTSNIWRQYKFNLSSFAGQTICVAFRYYMNTSVDGLWCNIDDVFIGNHSAIGIQQISSEVPGTFELKQNYPNPFNPTTNIEFSIAKTRDVNLVIYNSLGQLVQTLVNQELKPGTYKYDFNASGLPSGSYYYRLTAGDFVKTNKMILVK